MLKTLPLTRQFGTLLVCHSSPRSNDDHYPRLQAPPQELRAVYTSPPDLPGGRCA